MLEPLITPYKSPPSKMREDRGIKKKDMWDEKTTTKGMAW
jgi:hypothetical protein